MTARARALPSALAVLVLTGCATISPPLDLDGVLDQADAPPGMTWTASGVELTAGEDLESLEHQWIDGSGSPDECLPFYLLQYGVAAGDESADDRTTEVGFFAGDEIEGRILVTIREFPSDSAASDYIQHALESANDCGGYEINGLRVASDGVAVARVEGGHGLSLDGGTDSSGVSSRTVVARSGRTILVVDAFLLEPTGFDLTVVDEIAASVLARVEG